MTHLRPSGSGGHGPCPSGFGQVTDERVRAIVDMGFTDRQARFLVLVMRHSGLCLPRQYAGFAGIANGGRKCNGFFARLVRRGLAAPIACVHNRARLYHVHARSLYAAIGEGSSRYRRPVPAGRTAERLMLLDAVLTTPDLDWLTTAADKHSYLARLAGSTSPDPASDPPADRPSAAVRDLPGTLPIGIDSGGRVVLLYLATDPWTDRFRTFLQGHARLLRVAPAWTVRLAFPHPLEHFYSACQAVIRDELESPLHPSTIGELQSFFVHRRQSENGEPLHPMTRRFLNVGYKVFGTPRFTEMYHRWRRYGDMVFEGISSPTIAEALERGRGTVECLVLTPAYRHLSPLVAEAPATPTRVGEGLRRERYPRKMRPHVLNPRPQPPAEEPLSIREQCERDWQQHRCLHRRGCSALCAGRRLAGFPAGRRSAWILGGGHEEPVLVFGTCWSRESSRRGGGGVRVGGPGARVDRAKLHQIDLHWHDLRHEGACRLLADGVDIRIIQLMLGHASVQQTQRYLNVTDEELRRGLEVSWKRRTLKAVAGGQNA